MSSVNDVKLMVLAKTAPDTARQLIFIKNLYPSVFIEVIRRYRLPKESAVIFIKSQPYFDRGGLNANR